MIRTSNALKIKNKKYVFFFLIKLIRDKLNSYFMIGDESCFVFGGIETTDESSVVLEAPEIAFH